MSLPITSLRPPVALPALTPVNPSPQAGAGFSSVLADAIGRVDQFQQSAQSSIGKFLSGEDEEVHKVALATQQAAMSFDLFLQVRNKVVSAYQEVMRMQM
ncbi:MAG TPA: flagellar hook-basal body complex protein FliE [Bryobacteraceae bacterium]|jgi:flagellar hook-basal body complex protein FliE|nr:flagellar hook-basal body complex protein FliE [Bryobacteraceae bacterium]